VTAGLHSFTLPASTDMASSPSVRSEVHLSLLRARKSRGICARFADTEGPYPRHHQISGSRSSR